MTARRNRRIVDAMGRLILTLVGGLIAVMLALWVLHAVIAIFWIAVVVVLGFGVLKLGLWAGRKSRQ
jgi:hypothetical protein